jgi:hypothetical protein
MYSVSYAEEEKAMIAIPENYRIMPRDLPLVACYPVVATNRNRLFASTSCILATTSGTANERCSVFQLYIP